MSKVIFAGLVGIGSLIQASGLAKIFQAVLRLRLIDTPQTPTHSARPFSRSGRDFTRWQALHARSVVFLPLERFLT